MIKISYFIRILCINAIIRAFLFASHARGRWFESSSLHQQENPQQCGFSLISRIIIYDYIVVLLNINGLKLTKMDGKFRIFFVFFSSLKNS